MTRENLPCPSVCTYCYKVFADEEKQKMLEALELVLDWCKSTNLYDPGGINLPEELQILLNTVINEVRGQE